MGEVAVNIIKWAVKIGFWSATIFAFVTLITFIISGFNVVLNQSVIGELIGIMQIWLPFNFGTVITWLLTASIMYLTYRLAVFVLHFAMKFING